MTDEELARPRWWTHGVFTSTKKLPAGERVHGTHGGYRQHRRWAEPACDRCKAAEAAYQRGRKAARKAAASAA